MQWNFISQNSENVLIDCIIIFRAKADDNFHRSWIVMDHMGHKMLESNEECLL